jgi:hypothetical protein
MNARSIAMMQQGPTLFLPPSCLLKENHATIPEKPYTLTGNLLRLTGIHNAPRVCDQEVRISIAY